MIFSLLKLTKLNWNLSLVQKQLATFKPDESFFTQANRQIRTELTSTDELSLHPLAQYHNLGCEGMSKRTSLKQIKAVRLMEVVYSFFLRTVWPEALVVRAHRGWGPGSKVYRVEGISPHPEETDQVMTLAGHEAKHYLHSLMNAVFL